MFNLILSSFEIDLIIVENAFAIPINIPLGLAVTELLAETGIPTIAHNHDFFWDGGKPASEREAGEEPEEGTVGAEVTAPEPVHEGRAHHQQDSKGQSRSNPVIAGHRRVVLQADESIRVLEEVKIGKAEKNGLQDGIGGGGETKQEGRGYQQYKERIPSPGGSGYGRGEGPALGVTITWCISFVHNTPLFSFHNYSGKRGNQKKSWAGIRRSRAGRHAKRGIGDFYSFFIP